MVKLFIHGRRKIERLLSLESLQEQREFFDREWNTRRWRLLFPALLNRWTFNRAYDPAFFRGVENPSFADHFRRLVEHALCDVPVRNNYFLHQMLLGTYPNQVPDGVPPYLERTQREVLRARLDRWSWWTVVTVSTSRPARNRASMHSRFRISASGWISPESISCSSKSCALQSPEHASAFGILSDIRRFPSGSVK